MADAERASRVPNWVELRLTEAEVRMPTRWIVWLLTAAMVAAYVGYALVPTAQQNQIDFAFALIPERFVATSPWRFAQWYEALGPLFGHVFLHAGWWHVGLNACFFYATARLPALRMGALRFALLFVFSALCSAGAFLALNWGAREIAVGASGAVCGTFSAYFLSARPTWRDAIADPRIRGPFAMIFVFNVILMGFVSETGVLPIAWEAHLGGFVGGALAYVALAPKPRGPWG